MVPAMVAESQARGAGAGRLANELMPEADAQHRDTPNQLPRHGHRGLQLRRVTGPVGEDDRVGPSREDGVDVAVVRDDLDRHAARAPGSQNVAFDAVIDDDDLEPGPLAESRG